MAQRAHTLFLLVLVAALITPVLSLAQSETDLHSTIRAAIQSDSRSNDMSEADIEAMVTALERGAEAQGMSASDLTWRPVEMEPVSEGPCGDVNDFMCALTQALGFDGSNFFIPIGLGATATVLLFVLGAMLLHHHGHHALAGQITSPGRPLVESTPASSGGPPPLPPLPPVSSLYR